MKNRNLFIDIEADNKGKSHLKLDGYERNYVNVAHIIRVEKLEKKEDSKIVVYLSDGTTLHPLRTYAAFKRELDELSSQ